MEFVHISQILEGNFVGKTVKIRGWIYRKRSTKQVIFLILRDATGIIQTVVSKENPMWSLAQKATIESAIEVEGVVHGEKRAIGGFEVIIAKLNIINIAERFPITKDKSTSFLLDCRHLWLRSRKMNLILRLRSHVFQFAREFFQKEGFIEFHPPILITAACEGGSTLFELSYFGKKAYLTQSGQLYLETAIQSMEKVYCIAPSFRAEKSRTRRHLTEFWHIEAEEAFCDLKGTMATQERLIEYICINLKERTGPLLRALGREPRDLEITAPFEKIPYDKAITILQQKKVEISWGDDLGVESEKKLTEEFEEPFFIYNYPTCVKAFYHRQVPNNPKIVLCADMLAPEGTGEIIGGGERIYDLKDLLNRIKSANLNPEDYSWYIDLRRYGSIPHAGFGLGVERFIKWIAKLDHIRDAIPYPRTITRVYP
jgi:asparaginyl-tRNA synthetase